VPTAYMLDDRVGYLELTVFAETSTSEVQQAIQKLQAQGMKGLIIDLRRNPGGLLEQGVSLSDLFLKKGDEVVAIHGRMADMNQAFDAEGPDKYPNLPVVLVVGPYTASAAEIFSGALQDHDRALVVGETTYGKGSVQTLFPLSGGNYLKLTTARWYTPSGRSIQKPFHPGDDEESDADTTAVDTASSDSSRVYRTDAGRTVHGGGGIRPDLIVKPDTVTQAERDLAQALERFGSKFNDAVYAYAIKYANTHPNLRPGFQVTPDMRAAFYQALTEHGVTVDRRLYEAAAQAVSQRLAYEITYARWGETGRRRRLNGEDPEIKIAEKVLDQATTPQSVFAVASKLRQDTVSGPSPARQPQH
jgi:carboxyl-terminal processing protease